MPNDLDENTKKCIDAFVQRDYVTCAKQAMVMLSTGATPELLQMLLISLQRLEASEMLDRLGPQILRATATLPWPNTLLKLTLGQMDSAAVVAIARGYEQLCQAHYYSAVQLLNRGKKVEAQREIAAAQALPARCPEHNLAAFESDFLAASADGTGDAQQKLMKLNQEVARLYEARDYPKAMDMANQAYDLACQHLNERHPDFVVALNNLAELHRMTGNCTAAEPLLRKVVETRRAVLGECHPDFGQSIYDLATLCHETGKHEEAESLYRQAIDIRRKTLGADHPDLATALNNLAALSIAMDKPQSAEPLLQEAIQIWRAALGAEHPHVGCALSNLAELYRKAGKHGDAEALFRQAAKIIRDSHGEADPNFIVILKNHAELCRTMGNHAVAVPLLEQVAEIKRRTLGENDPNYFEALNTLADSYQKAGNHAAAEQSLKRVSEFCRLSLGEEHPDYADSLYRLGMFYFSMGNLPEAESVLRQAIEIHRKVEGKQAEDLVPFLQMLATICELTDKPAAAEPLYREVIDINRRTLGDAHPDLESDLRKLGKLYKTKGNYTAAKPLLEQAHNICRSAVGEERPEFASSLNDLATLHELMGDYLTAEGLFRQAMEIDRKSLGEEHADFARDLNNLAGLHVAMGNYVAAEPLYRCALDLHYRLFGKESPHFALSLNNLASVNQLRGDYAAAEPLYRQAIEVSRRVLAEGHSRLFAASLANLGGLYREMGNHAASEPLLRQAVEIERANIGGKDPELAICLNNLAEVHRETGNYEAALPLYQEALEIQRAALGEEHAAYAKTLNNLAMLFVANGYYSKAEPLYRDVLEIDRKVLGEQHDECARVQDNLAGLLDSLGNYAAAEPLYRHALEIRRAVFGDEHPAVAKSLNNLAGLWVAMGRASEALSLMKQAAAIDDHMIGQVFSIGSENQRTAFLKTVAGDFHGYLSLVWQHFQEFPDIIQSALDLVLRRKAIEAEALAAQRDAVLGGRYPNLQPQLQQLTILRMQIARKTLAGPGAEDMATHQQQLAEWRGQKERIEAELARQIPEMNLEQKLSAADREAVSLALPKESALVEYVQISICDFRAVATKVSESRWLPPNRCKPTRYFAFVLRSREPNDVEMIDLGEAASIDRLIAEFRAGITGEGRGLGAVAMPSALDDMDRIGAQLRTRVFDPILAAVGDCKRLLVAPDGDLSKLPFEVLPMNGGKRLIDDYKLTYVAVGRDVLRFSREATRHPAAPVVTADPDFDLGNSDSVPQKRDDVTVSQRSSTGRVSRALDRTMRFGRLEGTRKEGEIIARMLGVKPWLEAGALERRLKEVRSPQILHLATHGFFLQDQEENADALRHEHGAFGGPAQFAGSRLENPLLRSGLALAGANAWLEGRQSVEDAEDGILTAEDVTGLDLLDTELVVLSACETGLGEVRVGEGVFGLRRSFVVAGAQTLVMSLWKVPDAETQELMEDFYRRVLSGEPRADALRNAQLAMKAKHPNPRYWGAFICQGDPAALNKGVSIQENI